MRNTVQKRGKSFYIGYVEVTVREILVSVSIIAILSLIGVLISSKISESIMDSNEKYNKAIKIEDADMFEYGMRTNVGNAFVYGDLKAVDTVTYPDIEGEYMYVERVKERYTQHTRQVAHTKTVNGKTQTYYTTETYWTWDRVGHDDIKCKEISFKDVVFDSNKIDIPGTSYIDMVYENTHVRYKYYGTGLEHTGTIFTELKDNTITDGTKFYKDHDIEKTVERLENGVGPIVAFWIFWVILMGGCVVGFYYLDNKWLK